MTADAAPLFDRAERARLERLRLDPTRPRGVPALGERASRAFGTSGLFAEHREYAFGDDLRYVDWNVLARLGDMVVKRFEAEQPAEFLLVVDRSASMAGTKARMARRLAGALGIVALGAHDRVRLAFLPGGDASPSLHPGRGAIERLLAELAAGPDEGMADPVRELRRLAAGVRRRAMAIVVSDFLAPRGGVEGLAALRARGLDVAALHVVDVADAHVPEGEALELHDVETGRRLRVDATPEVAAAMHVAWRRHALRVAAACRRQGVRHRRIDARAPLWDVLPGLLGVGLRTRRGA